MKKNYLSVYKCNEFRVVSNEFVGRIEDTPENISAFVVSADFNCNYALVDDMDTVKVFTMGNYLEEFLGEKDLQLATEDTYKSMSETSKSFEEIEQDEFNHDDIEI